MGETATFTRQRAKMLGLGANIQTFAEFITGSAMPVRGSAICFQTRKGMAEYLHKSERTITRYINKLEEFGFILSRDVQTGPKGTVFLQINPEYMEFDSGENPFTEDGISATDFKNEYYPKSDAPKRERRKLTAEERVLLRKRKTENDKHNEKLAELEYPTAEFFKGTDNPTRNYQAYLLSRMYNAYAVINVEYLKREAIMKGDQKAVDYLQKQQDRYENFDCLPKEFMGTSNFTNFLKLRDLLEANNVDPGVYLSVQFQYAVHIYKDRSNRLSYPYINTLYGEGAWNRYIRDVEFHNSQAKKHPYYYHVKGQNVRTVGASEPIMQALISAYNNVDRDGNSYFETLMDHYDTPFQSLTGSNHMRMVMGYYKNIEKEMNETDLTEEEYKELSTYLKRQTITHLARREVILSSYLVAFAPSLKSMTKHRKPELSLKDFHTLIGNVSKFYGKVTKEELAITRVQGYKLDLSLNGNVTFYNALRTISDMQGTMVNPDVLGNAMRKVGKEKFAVNKHGMLDVKALYDKYSTPESIEADSQNTGVKFAVEKDVDLERFPWYNAMCNHLEKLTNEGGM